MTKARKVVMAAVVGSMLMGSMPAAAALNTGEIKIGIGSILAFVAGGLGYGAYSSEYGKSFAGSFCVIALLDAILLGRDGFNDKAKQEQKTLRREIRAEVVNDLDRLGLIKDEARKRMKDLKQESKNRRR